MIRNSVKNSEKHCHHCNVILTEVNWYLGDKNFKPQPRYRCKLCSGLYRSYRRGVDKGFGPLEYRYLYNKQQGCCVICSKHESEQKNNLSIDHNHQTGKVRGLICQACNTKLGWFENRKKLILDYLEIK